MGSTQFRCCLTEAVEFTAAYSSSCIADTDSVLCALAVEDYFAQLMGHYIRDSLYCVDCFQWLCTSVAVYRQRGRVWRQVQQGDNSLSINSECASSNVLWLARHQTRAPATSARSLPLFRQLVLAQSHAHLQPPTSSACLSSHYSRANVFN